MIGTTLNFIAKTLNNDICQRLKLNPSTQKVILSSIVDPSGSFEVKDSNVLLLKLINIEPDPIANDSMPISRIPGRSDIVETSPLYINLKIVLAAYSKPEQIQSGLDMLTIGMSYFQGKPVWNAQNTPELPSNVDRLVFEMETLDVHQLNHVWGAIGTKYLPSAMYKMKMLVLNDHTIQQISPNISSISTSTDRS